MIAEVERELRLRRRVYPQWVAAGKLSQQKADRQIAVMEAIAERLKDPLLVPIPELQGKHPVVLYFSTREDAADFGDLVRGQMTSPVEIMVPDVGDRG